jgi:ion channel-forming bestrophin family protein
MLLRKRVIINLMRAYAIAVKHTLRAEPGAYYDDLYPLIRDLPRYCGAPGKERILPMWEQSLDIATRVHDIESGDASPTSTANGFLACAAAIPLAPAQNPPHYGITDYLPVLEIPALICRLFVHSPAAHLARSFSLHRRWLKTTESYVPDGIMEHLHHELEDLVAHGHFRGGWGGAALSFVQQMQSIKDELAILTTTPWAVSAILRVITWLYLLMYGLTAYEACGRWMILGGALLAFGFLEILNISRDL